MVSTTFWISYNFDDERFACWPTEDGISQTNSKRKQLCCHLPRLHCTPTVTTLVTFCSRRWLEIQTEVLTDSNNIVKSVTPPHVITWRQLSADLWPLTSLLSTLTECFRDEIGLWTSLLTCREPPISDGSCCVHVCVFPPLLWCCGTVIHTCHLVLF